MNGHGPVIAVGALVAFVYLAVAMAAGVILTASAIAAAIRGRREARLQRTDEARHILRDLGSHIDYYAAHDPEVQAGFARLDAALRGQRKDGPA